MSLIPAFETEKTMSLMPTFKSKKFQCPHCNTVAKQDWMNNDFIIEHIFNINQHLFLDYRGRVDQYQQECIQEFLSSTRSKFLERFNAYLPNELSTATCHACNKSSVWFEKSIIFPRHISVEDPNTDFNDEIKALYNEASKIFIDSPRGATALLRLALQKLLIQVGKKGKNINNDIKELVSNGLNPKIQQALDVLRVVGNNAVHPGEINLDDNKDIALKLFKILNIIADELISKPKEIDNIYNDVIPEKTKNHINDRDAKK